MSSVTTRDKDELRPYQVWLSDWLAENPLGLLTVPMSLGKTASTLTAMRRLLDEFVVRRWLVTAPLRVAKETWPDEIELWSHTRALSYTLIRGEDDDPEVIEAGRVAYEEARGLGAPPKTAAKFKMAAMTKAKQEMRQRCVETPSEIHIINREMVPWLWSYWGDRWPYDGLVWDESSALKSWKKRTPNKTLTRFGAIAKARKHICRVIELTGTPAPKGLIDLGGQLYILDQGKRLGTSRTAFENRWFSKDYMGWKITPRDNAHEEIMSRVSDVMIGLRAEDHIQLPPVVSTIRPVRLPRRILDEYWRFERTLVSEVYDVEAVSSGVLTNKLLQFANGSMYRNLDSGKREIVAIHDLKLDELERIIEEAAGASVMVAYSFKFDLDRIKRKYPKAVVFDAAPNAVKDWNAGRIPLLLAHPASVGHGLNMQFGGHIAAWYGLTWSLELYLQFNMRLPRPGQPSDHVFIHHIVAEGTADEDVLEVMKGKRTTQDSINEAVRARILSR